MRFLSIDVGTSAVKAAVVDSEGRVLSHTTAPYPLIARPGGHREVDPGELWSAIYRACAGLDETARLTVEILAYDTFSPSPVLLKRDGSLSYPNIITHLDRRSLDQAAFIDRVLGNERYLSIAGCLPFAGGTGAMTFSWLRQNEPHLLAASFRIGHLPTYIHHRLTGEWVVDLVNASMSGLYETTTQGDWSKEVVQALDLPERLLSPIVDPGVTLGALRADEAYRLGVRAGIPVAVGTNDVASAHCGAGNFSPGEMINTAGSSDMISILTDNPVTSRGYYLRNAAIRGQWQIYATTTGGFALDWFFDQFCRDMSRPEFDAEFVPRALREHAEEGDVAFDPYLTGDRQSLESRTGAWRGLTLLSTREEMLSAMLRSTNRVLGGVISEARRSMRTAEVVKLTGGLTGRHFVTLKEREFQGLTLEVVKDCPLRGNVTLARRQLGLGPLQPESAAHGGGG